MQTRIPEIPVRDVLHFLGWRGTPVEDSLLRQIQAAMDLVRSELRANVITRCFALDADGYLAGTVFAPKGDDAGRLLSDSCAAILMAATLGAQSERLLLRHQARSSADALLVDAVLSAAIEAVCDEHERILHKDYFQMGLYLTDRFSPGYGDMPLEQTGGICSVLETEKSIGLTVAHSGIMIPRKSVTAILGVSRRKQQRSPSSCAICSMKETCALREIEQT